MGINWHKGAEGASKGLETILGVNQKSIEIMYDDIVRENRQRFASEEREKAQQFTTAEREAGQTYKAGESDKDRAIQEEQNRLRAEQVKATSEATNAYRAATLAQGERRVSATEASTAARTEDQQADNARQTSEQIGKQVEAVQKRMDELESNIMLSDEQKAAQSEALTYEMAATAAGRSAEFKRAEAAMGGSKWRESSKWAAVYASLPEEQRSEIDAKVGPQGDTKAWATAIYEAAAQKLEPKTSPKGDVTTAIPDQEVKASFDPVLDQPVEVTGQRMLGAGGSALKNEISKYIDGATSNGMGANIAKNNLKGVVQNADPEELKAVMQSLPPEQQQLITQIMNEKPGPSGFVKSQPGTAPAAFVTQ